MKILDIAFKDMMRSLRNRFGIGMMLVAPLVITALIFFGFGGASSGKADLPVQKVGVVNLDQAPAGSVDLGKMVVEMFNDPSVSSWLVASGYTDEAAARAAV